MKPVNKYRDRILKGAHLGLWSMVFRALGDAAEDNGITAVDQCYLEEMADRLSKGERP